MSAVSTSDIHPQAGSMLEAWDRTVRHLGSSPGLYFFDGVLTFAELDEASDALAAGLLDLGVVAGDRVGIFVQNDPQWLVTLIATWKCAATAVAINPMLREQELIHHLNDARPRVLVCLDWLYRDEVSGVRDRIPVEAYITTHPRDLLDPVDGGVISEGWGPKLQFDDTIDFAELLDRFAGSEPPAPTIQPESVALLTYTSGTTGNAKGAMNTHANFLHSTQVFAKLFDLSKEDVNLGIAPLFHITGSVAALGVTVVTGAPLVLLHRFDAGETLSAIEKRGISFAIAVSTAYIALMNHPDMGKRDVSSLVKTGSGGAAVSQALVSRLHDATGWQIRGAYGMTETTSPTHIAPEGSEPPVDPESGALAVGVPVPGARARICDADSGEPVEDGQLGEIVLSGPMVVPGYWEAPEETALAFRDGWFYTGDIGRIDENGWLFVVDRKKDLINAGGYKVWPREVEDVLYQHPLVREVAVVGVNDDYRGETVKAFVSLTPGATVSEQELIDFAKARIAAYKYPRIIEILDDIPKTASGKVLRRALRSNSSPVVGT
jgi:long-chain acyl-CoA synthetase